MFQLERFPERVVVVGAGFIACEFAGILRGLGVQVTSSCDAITFSMVSTASCRRQ